MTTKNDLVTLDIGANGAPVGEPEAWNPNIAEHNPRFNQTPEPEPIAISAEFAENFNVEDYLAEERTKDLLRFSTAGSVDDGKSTLIGRLLYDTQSVYDDQLQSIEGKGTTAPGVLDLALLTDGLRAEREQGITIDVAYRYFSTARRKFIIADTPGHEQYTRNMATGASTADVAIVLVDARKGVLIQSRRHAYITALLGVRHVIIAVNKMDLVNFDHGVFTRIESDFRAFFRALDVQGNDQTVLHFVPVSALAGDNVVHRSNNTPWYVGGTLLGLLESIPSSLRDVAAPFRMAVQRVIRPNLDFRGFAGQISAGTIRVGDEIVVRPGSKRSRVSRIVTFDGDLPEASAPLSVTLTLQDEIDISRGDLLVAARNQPVESMHIEASLVWMDSTPLDRSRRYLLKQGSRTVNAYVRTLLRTVNLSDASASNPTTAQPRSLAMNEIGVVHIDPLKPLVFDSYADNRHTGSFVLIDLETNATVAAGMMHGSNDEAKASAATIEKEVTLKGRGTLHLQGSSDTVATAIETLRNAGILQEEQP